MNHIFGEKNMQGEWVVTPLTIIFGICVIATYPIRLVWKLLKWNLNPKSDNKEEK